MFHAARAFGAVHDVAGGNAAAPEASAWPAGHMAAFVAIPLQLVRTGAASHAPEARLVDETELGWTAATGARRTCLVPSHASLRIATCRGAWRRSRIGRKLSIRLLTAVSRKQTGTEPQSRFSRHGRRAYMGHVASPAALPPIRKRCNARSIAAPALDVPSNCARCAAMSGVAALAAPIRLGRARQGCVSSGLSALAAHGCSRQCAASWTQLLRGSGRAAPGPARVSG
jgi:hypothetical protein